jgi:hypothetical protein
MVDTLWKYVWWIALVAAISFSVTAYVDGPRVLEAVRAQFQRIEVPHRTPPAPAPNPPRSSKPALASNEPYRVYTVISRDSELSSYADSHIALIRERTSLEQQLSILNHAKRHAASWDAEQRSLKSRIRSLSKQINATKSIDVAFTGAPTYSGLMSTGDTFTVTSAIANSAINSVLFTNTGAELSPQGLNIPHITAPPKQPTSNIDLDLPTSVTIIYWATMVLGIIGKKICDGIVDGHKMTLGPKDVILSLCISPIVFSAAYPHLGIGITSLGLCASFQNGFFWQTVANLSSGNRRTHGQTDVSHQAKGSAKADILTEPTVETEANPPAESN